MKVRSFKLIGGKELIAEVIGDTGMGYTIRSPLEVHILRGPDGQGQMAFAPWSMVHDPKATIEIFDHGLHSKPVELISEVEQSYMEQVTGLALPTPPSGRILTG